MNRQTVQSSNIHSVGYDSVNQLLEIEFHSGSVYKYHFVPSETHQNLMKAGSKGNFFHSNIRDKYRYKRVK